VAEALPILYVDREPPPGVVDAARSVASLVGPDPAALRDAVGIVAGPSRWDGPRLGGAPLARVLSRTGIGSDNVDIAAATARGIAVCVAPDAPTVSTAEHTVTMLLALARRLPTVQRRSGSDPASAFGAAGAIELCGRTLGLVGFGRIARRVARVANALDMTVLAHDPHVDAAEVVAAGAEPVSFLDLLVRADVLSLHAPASAATTGLLDERAFAAMREGAILVNCARGALVDHDALLAALASGRLAGAALDVTEPEPLPADHPLLARDDVIVTPHVASFTDRGRLRLFAHAIDNALAVLAGRPAPVLNPDVLGLGARS
jgi:phosphoglycerate dehydrogenase-like enzyme